MTSPAPCPHSAFTLLELLVVIGIIAIGLAFLGPALAPATGRAVDNSASRLVAELENARQIAIAERTRTRVLLPDTNSNSSFGSDLGLRAYTTVSLNKTATPETWRLRGRWTRLAQSAAFDPNFTPASQQINVIRERKTAVTPIDNSSAGSGATRNFTGAYVEFRPTGSTSLDPLSPAEVVVVADGIADGAGNMVAKNAKLKYQIAIDPLTGTTTVR